MRRTAPSLFMFFVPFILAILPLSTEAAMLRKVPVIDTLTSQDTLNAWAAQRGQELLLHLNTCGRFRFPEQRDEPHTTSSPHWDMRHDDVTDATGRLIARSPKLVLKGGVPASVALHHLLHESDNVIECQIAVFLVLTALEQELLGDHHFDSLHRHTPLMIPGPLASVGSTRRGIPETTGEIGYIVNTSLYKRFHPRGRWNGQNLLCVGTDLYTGFDPIFTEPRSMPYILDQMYQETIKTPTTDASDPTLHSIKLMQAQLKESRRLWENFKTCQSAPDYPVLFIHYHRLRQCQKMLKEEMDE